MKFTSMGKKIVCFLAALVLMLGIASGCEQTDTTVTLEQAQQNVNAVLEKIVFDSTLMESLTSNVTLVEKNARYPEVSISWTSSEEDVIKVEKVTDEEAGTSSLQGVVTRPEFDDPRVSNEHVEVTLTVKATQTVGSQVAEGTKVFNFKVKAVTLDMFGTIAEIKTMIYTDLKENKVALNANDYKHSKFCVTYGRVLYQWSKSMIISDGTDSITVYGDYSKECKVGDLVKVQGQVYSYYGQVEFGSEQQVTKLAETDKVLNPITKEEICEQSEIIACQYTDMEIQTYTDALVAAQNDKKNVTDVDAIRGFSGATYRLYAKVLKEDLGCGDKYALEDPKTGVKISIYHYATDGEALTAAIDAFVGKYVYINCITIDRYSSNDVFRVLWNGSEMTEAETPVLTDADKVKQAANAVKNATLEDAYYNGQDFTFPTVTVEGVEVQWTMNPSTALVDGKLVVEADGTVQLVATITCGEVSDTVELTINVYKEMKISTVQEVKQAAADSLVIVKGLVVAVYARGFVVCDTTGSILVYMNKAVDVKIGDYVKVSGKAGAYPTGSTAYQIGSPSYEILTESTDLTLAEAVVWTATELNAAWAEVVAGKYNFAGPLVNMTITVSVSGSYFNASMEGSDVKLSISYPLDSVKGYLVDGATITATLLPISYSNSNSVPTFFNFILVDVEANEQQQAEALVSGLNVPAQVEADFELPVVDGVSWTMKEASAAATLEGTQVTVTRSEADVMVVFVATGTVGETTATKEYTVVVKGMVEEQPVHAGTEADPFDVADARLVCDKLENKAYSDEMYYVKGIVVSVSFNSTYSSYTLYIADTEDGEEQFQVYSGNLATGVEAPIQGATVVAYGYMQKYNTTLELSGKNGVYPTISSVINPTVVVPENVVTYNWTANSGTIEGKTLTIDCGEFTIILEQNTSTTAVNNTFDQVRIYQGANFKIVANNGKTITGFEFTDLGGKNPTGVDFTGDANADKLSETHANNVWTFTATEGLESISFVTLKQMRFTSIKVTFAE